MLDAVLACGKLKVQRRAELLKLIEAPGRPLLDDEAFDLDNSWIPFAVCIQRPDGIAIHAEHIKLSMSYV